MTLQSDGHSRRRDAIRDQILDAAETLVRQNRAVSFTTRQLAEAANVSLATPFNHFGSKMGVLAALMARSFRAVAEPSSKLPADPVKRVIHSADRLIEFYASDEDLYRPLLGALLAHREADPDKAANAGLALFEAINIWRRELEKLSDAGLLGKGQNLHQLATMIEYQWLGTALAFVHFGLSPKQWQHLAHHAIGMALVPALQEGAQQDLLQELAKLERAKAHPFR